MRKISVFLILIILLILIVSTSVLASTRTWTNKSPLRSGAYVCETYWHDFCQSVTSGGNTYSCDTMLASGTATCDTSSYMRSVQAGDTSGWSGDRLCSNTGLPCYHVWYTADISGAPISDIGPIGCSLSIRTFITAVCTNERPVLPSCSLPWGGSILSGESVTAYSSSSVACGSSCSSQTRICNSGVLSGSYTSQSCSVNACASCSLPWGGSINHNQSVTAYQSSSVACGSSCVSQSRVCSNGVLSGSYTSQSCSVSACPSCAVPSPNAQTGKWVNIGSPSSVGQAWVFSSGLSVTGNCSWGCLSGYEKNGENCDLRICSGNLPLNSEFYSPDENINLLINQSIKLTNTNTADKCEAKCITNYEISGDGSSCVAKTREEICSGTLPADFNYNDSGLYGNYVQTWDGSNWVPTKSFDYNEVVGECNFVCESGFDFNGTHCVVSLVPSYCSGELPNNSNWASGDENNLMLNPPQITLVENNTDRNCEAKCITNYEISGDGSSCVPVVETLNCGENIPNNAIPNDGTDNNKYTRTWGGSNWVFTNDTWDYNEVVGECNFVCDVNYTYKFGQCVSEIGEKNEIIILDGFGNTKELTINIKCINGPSEFDFKLDNMVFGEIIDFNILDGNRDLVSTLTCDFYQKDYILKINDLNEPSVYKVIATLKDNCDYCSKQFFITTERDINYSIPDNNFLLIFIILFLVGLIIKKDDF
ncbi:MAG: hypothetical protein WC915_00065 [archaeon]|jgi:hypothetical protein